MMNNKLNYEICPTCIMDNTGGLVLDVDSKGKCNFCRQYDSRENNLKQKNDRTSFLESEISMIKEAGKGKEYDCVIGLSGGVDSSYVALLSKKYNLRVLAVHLDNGWNSDLAVKNIHNIVDRLGIDLYTHVINWQEFKDLQRSFIDADVIDIELLTDHAIWAVLVKEAAKRKIKYVITGFNIVTEAILPEEWIHSKRDWKNIKSIHKKFGNTKLKTFPYLSYWQKIWYELFNKLTPFDILNYIDYNKTDAINQLKEELDWQPYEGKHFESIFTRFYQAYILPKKFLVDKRKAHLSSLICSQQTDRDKALKILEEPIYDETLLNQDKDFVFKKLGYTEEQFDEYIRRKPISHFNYPTDEGRYRYYYYLKKVLKLN